MKRKIRKERQLRIQRFKKQKAREKAFSLIDSWFEESLSSHPYYAFSEQPLYAFIFVQFHYGMELFKPITFFFLHNRMTNCIEYCRRVCNNDDTDNQKAEESYEKLGRELLEDIVYIEDMISCDPPNIVFTYDSAYYFIFIKAGKQKRLLSIKTVNISKYKPYTWLFKMFNRIVHEMQD